MQEEQHCVQLFCPVNNLSLTAVLNWFNLKVVCAGGGAALLACYNSQWGRHENADKKVTVILVFTILYWKSSESALKTNWNPTFCEETIWFHHRYDISFVFLWASFFFCDEQTAQRAEDTTTEDTTTEDTGHRYGNANWRCWSMVVLSRYRTL